MKDKITTTTTEPMMFSVSAWVPTAAYQAIADRAAKHTAIYRAGVTMNEDDLEARMTKMTIQLRSVGRTQAMQTLVHLLVDSLNK